MTSKFTRQMKIFEALQVHPEVKEILSSHGMDCLACMGASLESLEHGARMHGIDAEVLLAELNNLVERKEA